MSGDDTPVHIWRAPLLLAAASLVGLLTALVGDGPWDAASWLLLGLPLGAIAWHIWRSKRS